MMTTGNIPLGGFVVYIYDSLDVFGKLARITECSFARSKSYTKLLYQVCSRPKRNIGKEK